MQVLLIQDRQEIREKTAFFLESSHNAKVFGVNSISEGRPYLKQGVNLILVDLGNSLEVERDGFFREAGQIPILYCVNGKEKVQPLPNVTPLQDRTQLLTVFLKMLQEIKSKQSSVDIRDSKSAAIEESLQTSTGVAIGDLCRIRTNLLIAISPLKGDIYIRLSDTKFLKLMQIGDVFDQSDMERYMIKKKVEYLYVRRDESSEIVDKYRDEIQKLASKKFDLATVEKLGSRVHEVIQELNSQIGFTKEVQELAKTQVQLAVKSVGKDPNLAEVLKRLNSTPGKYISSHSMLCSYLACAIAKHMDWCSTTTYYKLNLAAFLHDMTLSNHSLAAITSLEELEEYQKDFTPEEIKAYKEHPLAAAELARKMSEVPPDVDTIILQHHENSLGTGFPRKLGPGAIAPLAAVFIIAHDLTQFTLKTEKDFNAKAFIEQGQKKYTAGHFKKIMATLSSLKDFNELRI